jgi:hypothetical protein
LDEDAGERTFALVFETGDSMIEPLVEQVPAVRAGVPLGDHDIGVNRQHPSDPLEVLLIAAPAHLRKRVDPQTGLALIGPDQ